METFSKKFQENIDREIPRLGAEGQYIYRFENGIGASVIPEQFGDAVEIAELWFPPGEDEHNYHVGKVYRNVKDLDKKLEQIKQGEEK